MDEQYSTKNRIINCITFVVGFAAMVALLCIAGMKKPKPVFPAIFQEKKQILFLGDSNIDYGFEGEDVTQILNERTGYVTYNEAFGGTCAGSVKKTYEEDDFLSLLCLANLTKIMETKDVSSITRNREKVINCPSDVEAKILVMKFLDYKAMDYVVIHYGMNDYAEGETIKGEDPYDESTYEGGLRSSIERIHKICPNARIILSSITFCKDITEKEDITGFEKDFGGGTIADYRDAMKRVSEEYEYAFFLDNLSGMGVDETNYEEADILRDGMHLNQKGREMYVDGLIQLINETEQ
ncbi:MAG: SGNH/GDSL hydrolase family protein [Lachnospiraceae bacterium]|nr:SGNH/GDSL hydrolase family protein [Lachnospiraceae bacterium]